MVRTSQKSFQHYNKSLGFNISLLLWHFIQFCNYDSKTLTSADREACCENHTTERKNTVSRTLFVTTLPPGRHRKRPKTQQQMTSQPPNTLRFSDLGVIWHFLSALSLLMRQSLWENGKNEPGPRTLCLSVWPALSEAVDALGPEGPAETFLTIRCLGRREWHSSGRCSSALFSTQLGPEHIIPSPRHSTPSQWQREKTTVKQCRAVQACLLTSQSAKSTHSLNGTHAKPNNYQHKWEFTLTARSMQIDSSPCCYNTL